MGQKESPTAICCRAYYILIVFNEDYFSFFSGAFVEFLPGKDGLLHISEIDWKRLETVEEAGLKEGDHIQVKLVDIDQKTGKFKLSRRVVLEKPEGYVERPARRERPERGERRERRPRNDEQRGE